LDSEALPGSFRRKELAELVPANDKNVDLLIQWTLDPIAQGQYKRVPPFTPAELRPLFLNSPDRWYFLIRDRETLKSLGRFYYRAFHFNDAPMLVDWELNILIAEPGERGRGYGTSVQILAADFLLSLPQTHSVFAYTMAANTAERRALEKAGFIEKGLLPSAYYDVGRLPPEPCVLYIKTEPAPIQQRSQRRSL